MTSQIKTHSKVTKHGTNKLTYNQIAILYL